MTGIFEPYLQDVSSKFSRESTSEMGYRTDLEILLKKIFETIKVHQIDHDPKAAQHNKPDFVILSNDIPIMYLEAKDIGVSLDKIERSDQMARYYGYANLVLTDYLEFRFYRNGLKYGEAIKIADYNLKTRTLELHPENFENLSKTLIDFTKSHKEPIKSGKHLAKIMGGKAQRIRDNIRQFFSLESGQESDLNKLYKTLKELLVHDLTPETFADMYAQTLVYGLFVARYNDKSPGSFSRREAGELIPNSNPFLRNFFDHIVGIHFDNRLKYIVDELCEVFSHADVHQLMQQYFKTDLWGETHEQKDPVIHFYEDFLNEYDAGLRKKMGAYYTPPAVVNFIVRSVDYLLKKEFNLASGLADTSKTKDGIHKVQILDPACGTGTFISSTINLIYDRLEKSGQHGRWPAYVHHDLLPRIYGFELMMTPYTIAHLKIGIDFRNKGFWDFHRRLGIYLTNSLEEGNNNQQQLFGVGFAESISKESKDAAEIKSEKPIMVVMGNPPYSGVSSNETKYANSLVEKYKVEPGGKIKLQERKHWLNDDYVKFMALAENMVEKNGEGILGFITNHGYLDNPTFRGMRWHLRETFDKIYIIDLHGNANKNEINPLGGKDENIFDIKTGVAIIICLKKNIKKVKQGEVFKFDIFGFRKDKFNKLNSLSIQSVNWEKILETEDIWVKQNKESGEYKKGFSVGELFKINNTGICSQRDEITIHRSINNLRQILENFILLSESEIRTKYKLKKDGRDWTVKTAKKDVIAQRANSNLIRKIDYRPFDTRYTFFTGNSKGFIAYPRGDVFRHLKNENLAILVNKTTKNKAGFHHIFVTKNLPDLHLFETANASIYASPLYLYSDDGTKTPNLNAEIVSQIEKIAGKTTPEEIFDYIYAVLHSPQYREKYKEFLKISFPRVPYPKDKKTFKDLVKFGTKLRQLHLLEAPEVNQFITTYPIDGSNQVEKITYQDKKVFINKDQYFGQVPETAWNSYIGGYQPAQKWLKDRKGQELNNEDIEHYQQMIVALIETEKIMKEIDQI